MDQSVEVRRSSSNAEEDILAREPRGLPKFSRPTDIDAPHRGYAPTVSVVVPTHNEAKNLPHVLPEMPDEVTEVIVVDGHSDDKTLEVVQALCPKARIVLQDRRGKGNALSCGFAAATGDIIVTLDADGSADPREIPRFVAALRDGADLAKGSRYLDEGGSADLSHFRSAGNRVLATLVNVLFGTKYTDLCYGYNAFWRHYLPVIHRTDSDGFEIETVLKVRAARAQLNIAEVPSFEHERIHGVSNLNAIRDGFRVLHSILRERFRERGEMPAPEAAPASWRLSQAKAGRASRDDANSHPLDLLLQDG